jgi:5'-methylthioadenosine phosphorylase
VEAWAIRVNITTSKTSTQRDRRGAQNARASAPAKPTGAHHSAPDGPSTPGAPDFIPAFSAIKEWCRRLLEPQHIRIKPSDLAEKVIVVGDPARAKFIAENLLEDARLVHEARCFHIYTGTYGGERVSVAVHGIGAGSAAIVFEELRMLGAKVMIRLGTAGGLIPELRIGDAIVATGAAYIHGGTIGSYVPDACMVAAANPILATKLYENARRIHGRVFLGPVFSSDAFYAEDKDFVRKWSSRGIIAVEMEVATLYALAAMRGFDAAALLVVSDNLAVPGEEKLRHHEELEPYVEKAARAVLETLREYKPTRG